MAIPKRTGPIPACPGPWDNYVAWYALDDSDAPHEPNREDVLASISSSMSAEGWTGRPLLAIRYGQGLLTCQTGSHRLAAARAAKLDEVPVVAIDCSSALEGEDVPQDGTALMIGCAREVSADLAQLVQDLWDEG